MTLPKILKYGSQIVAILGFLISTYEFVIGNVGKIEEGKGAFKKFTDERTGNGKIIETGVFSFSGNITLYIDPTPGIVKAKLLNYELGEYYLTGNYYMRKVLIELKNAIDQFMDEYARRDSIDIEITGYADGNPVKPGAKYNGEYGCIRNFEVKSSYFIADTVNLYPLQKIENHHIAFLRAYDISYFLEKIGLIMSNRETTIKIKTTELKGGEYRKVLLKISIRNALKEEYTRLSWPSRALVNAYNFGSELEYTWNY